MGLGESTIGLAYTLDLDHGSGTRSHRSHGFLVGEGGFRLRLECGTGHPGMWEPCIRKLVCLQPSASHQ